MLPIELYYHLYVPPDWRACFWSQYIDNHIDVIKRSRLYSVCNFNLTVTMPMHWTEVQGYHFTYDKTDTHITFSEKIKEYISLRYPEVKLICMRDVGEPNLYEGLTLNILWEEAFKKDRIFCYIHSKGISNYSPAANTENWRQVLDYFIIDRWNENLRYLDTHDVLGVKDLISSDLVLSGNFWWTKSSYIKRLPNPLNIGIYYPHPEVSERYAYERWITASKPKIHYVADTKTNHYKDYCFLENLL